MVPRSLPDRLGLGVGKFKYHLHFLCKIGGRRSAETGRFAVERNDYIALRPARIMGKSYCSRSLEKAISNEPTPWTPWILYPTMYSNTPMPKCSPVIVCNPILEILKRCFRSA